MEYTVWRGGALLGRTDLAMPMPTPIAGGARVGRLDPASAFAHEWTEIGPIIAEFLEAGMVMGSAASALPPAAPDVSPEERGRQIHEALVAHPGAERTRAAHAAVTALGLELRDEAGHRIPTTMILISEVRLPAWIPAAAIERDLAEARAAGYDVRVPDYIVTVLEPAADSEPTPQAPPA